MLAEAQRWGYGIYGGRHNGSYTAITTGRGGYVPREYATWLESDMDEPPVFPGGGEALVKYFTTVQGCDEEAYGPECLKDRKVLVWFIVEHDGSVQEAWIDRGGCDALQVRTVCAVLNMPVWTPGRRKGEVVRTRVRIPVQYEPLGETP